MNYLNKASRAARMFPQLPVSRFIISFNDFDLHLVSKERDVLLIYKIFNFVCSVCMEILLVPFFILPSPLQRIVTQFSCSVAVTYLALGIYRLSILYPVYVSIIVAAVVVVLLVLLLGIWLGARLTPLNNHQNKLSSPGDNIHPSHDNDAGYIGSESQVSWIRYFFGTYFRGSAHEYRIGQSSFTELHQDGGGEMKLDGVGAAASLRTWKSRHQLEAVPEQSENASEDEAGTTAEHKVDAVGTIPNLPDPSRKRKKSLTDFAASPPARKAVRQRTKLRKKRLDETDNDSYGPGASINSIDEEFITIESNHSSADKPNTVMSDITPLDNGILKGPGSTMYQVREDKSTAHPMWR